MTEVPKIVYDRLRAARPEAALPGRDVSEPAHPDADLLTAFAEQALSATERGDVIEHLALCGDCREVVALALPAADLAAGPITAEAQALRGPSILAKAERSWRPSRKFSWPGLRWAALAAGVALAASVLLMHPGKLNQATLPSANRQAASTTPSTAVSDSGSPKASPPAEQPATLVAKSSESEMKLEPRLSRKLDAGRRVTPSPQAMRGFLVGNKKDLDRAAKLPPPRSAGATAFGFNASTVRGKTETVEATGAAEVAPVPSPEVPLMARNDGPAIEKAKPALQDQDRAANEQQKTESTVSSSLAKSPSRNVTSALQLALPASQILAQHFTWKITAGVLQRSLDSGQSWQSALHADHSLLCSASLNADVWTGGQAGTLFHSANSGVTWVPVHPSFKGQAVSADVTHIDLRGPAEIVVSTNNNEIWSSADGGTTWKKK
jgi:hypothetical protein